MLVHQVVPEACLTKEECIHLFFVVSFVFPGMQVPCGQSGCDPDSSGRYQVPTSNLRVKIDFSEAKPPWWQPTPPGYKKDPKACTVF